jgi:hypothetical protein
MVSLYFNGNQETFFGTLGVVTVVVYVFLLNLVLHRNGGMEAIKHRLWENCRLLR